MVNTVNIEDAKKVVTEFLKKTLNTKEMKIVKIKKVANGWEAVTEVFEESAFIKSLGLPTKVQDRNIYELKLASDLEIESYQRKDVGTPQE